MRDAALSEQFDERGYVVLERLLDPRADLQPLVDDYSSLLDTLAARWYAEGALAGMYPELPFGRRLVRIISESGLPYSQFFDISLPLGGISADTPIHLSPAVFDLLRHPRLLDAVEAIIGPEILSNPIQHVRLRH